MLDRPRQSSLALGFPDYPRDSQRVFRAVMNAMARPAVEQALAAQLVPPPPLPPELAALALALADHDAPLWLDAPLAEAPDITDFLRFHTGALVVDDPRAAAFALVAAPADLIPFDCFALGTEEYPDRSATILMAVDSFSAGAPLTIEGPGMAAPRVFAPTPVPADLADRLKLNRALFPRGLDLVFTRPGHVAAVPRSARIVGGA